MTDMRSLLSERAQSLRLFAEVRDQPDSTIYHLHRNRVAEIDEQLRSTYGPHFDVEFRQMVALGRGGYDADLEHRALGATARGVLGGGDTFVSTFSGALAAAAPLFALSTVVPTDTGEDLDFSYVATLPTANGIVAEGATITASDPTFNGGPFKSYAYKDLIEINEEVLTDGKWNVERWAAEQMGPNVAYKVSADLWAGNGTTAPQGLMAGLSTVTAAGAAIVTFDDIAALLNAVPAAYRYNGRCTIILSPGAHIDLLEEQPLHPGWSNSTIHGFPFVVDANLADPATTTKSVVAGDFATAYAIRVLPLRVALDKSAGLATDRKSLRTVLRADGKRMVTNAARALVHP